MSVTKRVLLWLMAVFYVLSGISHFVNFDRYVAVMPGYVPWHGPLVIVTGLAEVTLGVAVLVPKLRRPASWGLVALLVLIFPANVNVAVNDLPFLSDRPSRALNWMRLPFQALFILWAWWYTKPDQEQSA